ncbi:NAD(P)-dependent alcohol dehydrogenase [Actinomyces sp. 2119]|uniref:NAD(P)-dependent alcohol dehydrogenase n=1 Tax=Actinomyces lilanjuaniae TaxID=2321394 RepID=A0ABN5PM14_9ACTO|nr:MULTISPECIES: NAD(P)-dependent alcohol dehydrogenase [Actinomyces]AYD89201.1 NAD(P)-dependent alcohol dehydrogenase [Actinomyces lilanjuaniae]RJF41950.1 NAD(P)-dependent alcohol dehydrogenase [Actinomyces sp. 2119]
MDESQMWAVQYRRYGGPEVMEVGQAAVPSPSAAQVLVEVSAFSLNQLDLDGRAGRMRPMMGFGFPKGSGVDFVGRVVQGGGRAAGVDDGDVVWGYTGLKPPGRAAAAAQYVATGADQVARAPRTIPPGEAAALPLVGLTALQALRALRVGSGKQVLVVGGNGGVGSATIQVARLLGAEVDAVVGRQSQAAERAGARQLYNYHSGGPEQITRKYDAVVNAAGASMLAYRRTTARGGEVMALSPAAIPLVVLSLLSPGARIRTMSARSVPEDLTWLADRVDDGSLVPIIDTSYELKDVARMHEDAQARSACGKRVVVVGQH